MATFVDWVTDLTSSQTGRIWFSNFRFDIDSGNLIGGVTDDFESAIARVWTIVGARPFELIDEVLEAPFANFHLRCERTPSTSEPYTRVMSVGAFSMYNVRL